MSNSSKPLPQMLKFFRTKKGLTQAQVAEQLVISRATYANFEVGRVIPTLENVMLLSKILDHDFTFAYEMSKNPHKPSLYSELRESPAIYNYSEVPQENKLDILSKQDRRLIETYIKIRSTGGNANDLL